MAFPLIPCSLCGSQPNLQRNAIKAMLAAWEREHPGRTESILSALRRVEPATLADRALFDFAALVPRAARHGQAPAAEELCAGLSGQADSLASIK
jgi:tRNA 2-thiocytidine biosynthesis protein TtcA